MIRGLLGRKVGMTQIFDPDGNVIPVTVIEAGPCPILELMEGSETQKRVKVGFLPEKKSRLTKPKAGYFKKIGVEPVKIIREIESSDNKEYAVGQTLKADVFRPGDYVDVTAVSRGKGFQGGMKRWNWGGGPGGHGSMHHRRVGSIGASADPSRTFKGLHMPGHMGARRVTNQGLRVMSVDPEKNLLVIKGTVPGWRNGLVMILRSKKKAYRSLDEQKAAVVHKRNPMKQSKAKAKGKKK